MWEYKVVTIGPEFTETSAGELLNHEGREGWELTDVILPADMGDLLVFKRPTDG